MELLGWLVTAVALIGVVLNARGNIVCFYLWVVSNGFYAIVNVRAEAYSQAALFGVQFGLAIYGHYCWKRRKV